MKKTNSPIIRFIQGFLLMALLICTIPSAKAGPEQVYLYFDYTNSGYTSDQIWLSWGQGNAGAGQIYYGVGNTGAVTWTGANLLSDPIALSSVLAGASGGLQTNTGVGGFMTSNAPSMNLYVSYGGTATNNIFLNPNQGLTNSPSFGSIYNNIFPVQTVEISHVANNLFSGGDLTAINILSVDLELRSYAVGQTNPATFLERAGLTNSIQNVFNNELAAQVNYTAGDIWNPAVAVDQNGRPIRVIPPNSLPTGEIGTWQSWSNALQSIHASNNTTYVSNFNGFAYYDSVANNTTGFVGLAYSMATTVDTNNNIIFTGSVGIMTNNDITQTFATNFTGLSITNFGGTDAASDALQSSTIYNQITTTNTGFSGNWTNVLDYISANNIVANGFNTNQGPLSQAFTNVWAIPQENAVGDYTTALAVGLVNSQVTNQQYPGDAIGTLSSYEWFYKANPGGTIGITNVDLFGGLQSDPDNYNGYVETLVKQSTNTVYANPYGDRIVGNRVFLSSISNGGEEVGAWVIGLKSPLNGITPPSWNHPTNILSGVSHTTNGIFYVGETNSNNLLVVRGVATLAVTNGVGGISSVIGDQEASSNNLVIISGIEGQSTWSNTQGLIVGSNGANNTLQISNAGFVYATNLVIGVTASSTNNIVSINDAQSQLIVMAAGSTTGLVTSLDVRNGSLIQNAGQLTADALYVTNGANSSYQFNGGLAILNSINVSNGQNFQVGNGTSTASMRQIIGGTTTNSFADGLTVNSNATFQFSGVVSGDVTLKNGSTFAGNGTYAGDLTVSNGATVAGGILSGPTYSPGTLTVASNMTWGGGGQNLWFINSFTNSATNGAAQAGVQFNSVLMNGALDIQADNVDHFVINLNSLVSSNNTLGLASFFDPSTLLYSYTLVQANGGISNFNADSFFINTNNFANAYTGYWFVGTNGNNLTINYTNAMAPTPTGHTNTITGSTISNSPYVVGNSSGDGILTISNSGSLTITNATGVTNSFILGNLPGATNNKAILTDSGSVFSNAQTVIVGRSGSDNSLVVSNGASFYANNLIVGANAGSSNNFVTMSGGSSQMIITNAGGTGSFNVLRGTNTQNGGTLRTDNLNVNGNQAFYNFNGGTSFVGVANISNGQNFQVGNGSSAALFRLAQNGQTNTFANGLTINTNAVFSLGGFVTNQITLNGGTLKGSGTYVGDLTVGAGSTLSVGNSPGTLNQTGTQTWAGGATNIWEINSFTGTQGVDPGWDFINIVGDLDITATSGNQFFLDVASLTLLNTAGLADGFNDTSDYNFILVQTTLGVTGFAADKFNLSTANFQNPFTGTWALGVTGNNLMLSYTATVIPEPSTYALLLFGALALSGAWFKHRRTKQLAPMKK